MTMKKIFSILSLVLMLVCCNFALTSCGDDDEDETTEKNVNSKIIGTWELFDPQYPDMERSPFTIDILYTFNADGTFIRAIQGINYAGTDVEGYMLKLKGTYTFSDDKLILNGEQSYSPAIAEDPYNAQWQEDKWTETCTIEWLNGYTVMRIHSSDEQPNESNTYRKRK